MSEKRFRVGDTVQTNSPRGRRLTGVIEKPAAPTYRGEDWWIRLTDFDGFHSYPRSVVRQEIELTLVKRGSQEFRLRHGDTIVNNKTGRVGHVVEGQDEVLWVVDHTYCEESGATAVEVEGYEELHPGTYEITKRAEPF